MLGMAWAHAWMRDFLDSLLVVARWDAVLVVAAAVSMFVLGCVAHSRDERRSRRFAAGLLVVDALLETLDVAQEA